MISIEIITTILEENTINILDEIIVLIFYEIFTSIKIIFPSIRIFIYSSIKIVQFSIILFKYSNYYLKYKNCAILNNSIRALELLIINYSSIRIIITSSIILILEV